MVSRWAPAAENDTGAYVDFVAARMGIDADEDIDLAESPAAFKAMTAAIIRMENGEDPYRDEEIADALTLALA